MDSIYKGIKIHNEGKWIYTEGLTSIITNEIRILNQPGNGSLTVLKYILGYILDNNIQIQSEQTISYYSWILMFQLSSEGYFDIWEAKRNGSGYQEGVINATNVNIEQINECKNYNVNPIFPNFSQKVVISNGVLEGNTIEAVRYPSPEHMTGWWLTTDLYNGDVDTLSVVHFYHIAFERPELLKYLALPFGYRFIKRKEEEEVWFDEEVLSDTQ